MRGHYAVLGGTDHKDLHVAAAAVACAPSVLVTWNLSDFDPGALAASGVRVTDPDTLLCELAETKPELVLGGLVKSYSFVVSGKRSADKSLPLGTNTSRSWPFEECLAR